MPKKPTLTDVGSIFEAATSLNNNWDAIQASFDNTLSRDGSGPNQMQADIDLNGNDLLNIGTVSTNSLTVDGEDISTSLATAESQYNYIVSVYDEITSTVEKTYTTVADMQTDPNAALGAVVKTLGYSTAGDKGGALYELVAASTGTDDGGSYIDLSGSGLQAKLLHFGHIKAEQFGATDGKEFSSELQAAWDALLSWRDATYPTESRTTIRPWKLITLSHQSRGTLANQVSFQDSDGGLVWSALFDLEGATYTAVSGGDLSSTNAMLKFSMNGGVLRCPRINGGKFAAGIDFSNIAGSRIYDAYVREFKGVGIRVRGACGAAAIYNPRVYEYDAQDTTNFNDDSAFTATGFQADAGDFAVYNANILYCKLPLELTENALEVHFVDAHIVNGNPNYDGTTILGRPDCVIIESRATHNNFFSNPYFDNGYVLDYGGYVSVVGGHYVKNNQADISYPYFRIIATAPSQTSVGELNIRNLSGQGNIGFVDDGANTWSGDYTLLNSGASLVDDQNWTLSAYDGELTVFNPQNDKDVIQFKATNTINHYYQVGAEELSWQIDPVNGIARLRKVGGDNFVYFGGGSVGIGEEDSDSGSLKIMRGSYIWEWDTTNAFLPVATDSYDIGSAAQRVRNLYSKRATLGDEVTFNGGLNRSGTQEIDISAVTTFDPTHSMVRLSTLGATVALTDIGDTNAVDGDLLYVFVKDNADTVTIASGLTDVKVPTGGVTLDNWADTVTFRYFAGKWMMVAFADSP